MFRLFVSMRTPVEAFLYCIHCKDTSFLYQRTNSISSIRIEVIFYVWWSRLFDQIKIIENQYSTTRNFKLDGNTVTKRWLEKGLSSRVGGHIVERFGINLE